MGCGKDSGQVCGKDSGKDSGRDSGKDLGRILGWKNPLRKVIPGGQNVDLWATPHGELAGGGEELVPGLKF